MNCLYFPTFVLHLSWMSAAVTQLFSVYFNHISSSGSGALWTSRLQEANRTGSLTESNYFNTNYPHSQFDLIEKTFFFYKFPLSKQLADTFSEAYFSFCLLDLNSISKSLSAFCYLQDQKLGFSFSSCLCSELAATAARCSGREELGFVIACSRV